MTFDDFWAAYPKRMGRMEAKVAWEVATFEASPDEIIDGAKRYATYCKQHEMEHKFISMPAKWLSSQRWTDEYPGPPKPKENDYRAKKMAEWDRILQQKRQ